MKSKVFKGVKVKGGGRKWTESQVIAHAKAYCAKIERKSPQSRAVARAIERHIGKSDKAPPGYFKRAIGKVQDATTKKGLGLDKKLRLKGLKLPWLLIAIAAGIIVVACFIIFRKPLDTEIGLKDIVDEDFRP